MVTSVPAFSQEVEQKEAVKERFKANTYILEHIADSHEWHIVTLKNGKSIAIYLPVILISKESGLNIFSSRRLAYGKDCLLYTSPSPRDS